MIAPCFETHLLIGEWRAHNFLLPANKTTTIKPIKMFQIAIIALLFVVSVVGADPSPKHIRSLTGPECERYQCPPGTHVGDDVACLSSLDDCK
jgi:hypothetical protein